MPFEGADTRDPDDLKALSVGLDISFFLLFNAISTLLRCSQEIPRKMPVLKVKLNNFKHINILR